jgi:hypothetical protein
MRLRYALAVALITLDFGCARNAAALDTAILDTTIQDTAIQDATIMVDFTNPALSPSHWTLTLHPDGSGHFRSEMGKPPSGVQQQIDTPSVDRDVQLSPQFAARVFALAERHSRFNEQCESRLKVAFQGWKKFSYAGPAGTGSCTFNYSKDKEMEGLSDNVGAVAETILEGQRLETLLTHDRLGLDKEMEYLIDAAGSGRAQQICAIRDILSRLAQDDEVMDRVRKRARMLLAQGDS